MSIPAALAVIDAINTVMLFFGSIMLMRFLSHFGTGRMRAYSRIMCAALAGYALVHEAGEAVHWIFNLDAGFSETIATSVLSLIFLAASIMVRREMKIIMAISLGGRKHGSMRNA